jgi:UDPglucose--hexose-1-phosphate uridylyltransferase
MNLSDLQKSPHRRFNPLTREWVLVSPHRTERPWLGRVEELPPPKPPAYDPECYLCPGNVRAGGARNPKYESTFVFENDYPALHPDAQQTGSDDSGLLVARAEGGVCRVVCFSPRHDLAIPRMSSRELRGIVDVWVDQYESLGKIPWIQHVQIFENRGALMGCSNPHPHCQIWANSSIPNQPAKELLSFREFRDTHKSCLLCEYTKLELRLRERIVCENDAFAVVVPYWAVWPFETLLLSKRHTTGMDELTFPERDLLADILKRLTIRYDNLFQVSFPYTMGFHQRPTDGQTHPEWHFHAHYYPPLLRSATVQKFMVGYELLATPQRDITPESAAASLLAAREMHYLDLHANRSGPG